MNHENGKTQQLVGGVPESGDTPTESSGGSDRLNTNSAGGTERCELFLAMNFRGNCRASAVAKSVVATNGGLGWGIGTYNESTPYVSCLWETISRDNKDGFSNACNNASDSVIIGRFLQTTAGSLIAKPQPAKISFLGRDWLFVHDATDDLPDLRVPQDERQLTSKTRNVPHLFEFFRNRALEYIPACSCRSLTDVFHEAFSDAWAPSATGGLNLIITNGRFSVFFAHGRPFYQFHDFDCGTDIYSTKYLEHITYLREFPYRTEDVSVMVAFSHQGQPSQRAILRHPFKFDRRRSSKVQRNDFASLFDPTKPSISGPKT